MKTRAAPSPLTLHCPTCSANPGQLCREGGRLLGLCHPKRRGTGPVPDKENAKALRKAREETARDVACPRCAARIGRPCVYGGDVVKAHASRVLAGGRVR